MQKQITYRVVELQHVSHCEKQFVSNSFNVNRQFITFEFVIRAGPTNRLSNAKRLVNWRSFNSAGRVLNIFFFEMIYFVKRRLYINIFDFWNDLYFWFWNDFIILILIWFYFILIFEMILYFWFLKWFYNIDFVLYFDLI